MPSQRALLMIADIGGYTEYMRTHRMSLAHAEVNTARLLEAVVDAAPGFELIEIEGDAAFLSRDADALDGDGQPVAAVTQAAAGMHRAFHAERRNVVKNLCPCDGCSQAENLRLKFVAHIGEVASQRIKDRHKLVGPHHHNRKAALGQPEALNVERAPDEWGCGTAGLVKIVECVRVGLGNDAPHARKEIPLDGRKGRERIGERGDGLAVATELVNHNDGALGVAETQELGLQRDFLAKRRETFPSPSRFMQPRFRRCI